MKISIYPFSESNSRQIPFYESGVKAGFPSPAQDLADIGIDLNGVIIPHPETSFLARVDGNSMEDGGILDNDILVIERSPDPKVGYVAICYINGEFTVKRISIQKGKLYLVPANKSFQPIAVEPCDDFIVWGVVTYCIHKLG